MNGNDVFYTRTMAKVYADQGNLEKASDIYKYLLACEPGRNDLIEALSEVERRRQEQSPARLMELFGQWIDLLLLHQNLQQLEKLKRYFKPRTLK
ncbi:MAG: hypothetical protein P8012_13730 [Desulfobacterales bacterium]